MARSSTGGPGIRNRSGVRLKGLKRYSVRGNRYVYHRASGTKLPTGIPEDHPLFLEAYLKAENGSEPAPKLEKIIPNSVADVCRGFLSSRKFRDLSKDYQDTLRRDMNRLCLENNEAIAKLPISAVKRKHIELQMDKLDRNPGNQRLKSWRYLTEFAIRRGIVSTRATEGVKANPELKTGGHSPWTWADIKHFREFWPYGSKQRLGFELQYWAGARISDTRKLGPKNIDSDGWLNFIQEKTHSPVSVPIKRALPEFAEPSDLKHLLTAMEAMPKQESVWLLTAYGEVRSKKGASQWFAAQARKAGLVGLTSHGLRKSRMILHAENGASSKRIAAWSGHETLKEIERYVQGADRRRLLTPSVLETGEFL
jgi:integrase